jgi:hypothetical protein
VNEGELTEAGASGAPETASDDTDGLAALGDSEAIFEALWKRVLAAWDDDRTHAAILEHALKTEKLPDLAGHYRALKDDPEKGPIAAQRIDRLVAAATQMLFTMKTPVATKTPWQWTAAAALMFLIAFAVLLYQFLPHRFRR